MEERGGGRVEIGVGGIVVVERQGDETAKTLARGDAGDTWIGGGGGGREQWGGHERTCPSLARLTQLVVAFVYDVPRSS